jgi:hypothetical protein
VAPIVLPRRPPLCWCLIVTSIIGQHVMHLITVGAILMLAACNCTGARVSLWEVFTGSVQRDPAPGPLVGVGEVSPEMLTACRESIAARTQPLGATWIDVASAGNPVHLLDGGTGAPIETRITYEHDNKVQVRQARVTCRLDEEGRVVELL